MDFDSEFKSNKPTSMSTNLEKGAFGESGLSHSPVSGDSPSQTSDKLQKSTSGSGSTDDFEHVDHDPFMSDSGFPSSTSAFGSDSSRAGGDGGHLLDDFLGDSKKQFDHFKTDVGNEFSHVIAGAKEMTSDFMSSLGDKISMTQDFMSAERGGFGTSKPPQQTMPPAPAVPISPVKPEPPVQQSLFDDIMEPVKEEKPAPAKEEKPTPAKEEKPAPAWEEKSAPVVEEKAPPVEVKEDKPATAQVEKTKVTAPTAPEFEAAQDNFSFFDSPVKKISKEDNEKFISSEDLLGDFSDARRTPEPALPAAAKPAPVAPSAPVIPAPVSMPEPIAPTATVIPPQPKEEPKRPEPAPKTEPKPEESLFSAAAPPKPAETVKPAVVTEPPKPVQPAKPLTPPAVKAAPAPATKQMISAEEIFCRYGLDAWFKPDRLHPVVESLIYWRDVKKSGIVFGAGLVILLAISCFSVISVFAYLSLISLAGTIAFRIYKNVLGAIQKTSDGHPFKEYLELDLAISQEKAQNVVSVIVAHVNGFISELRRLFLVDDLVDSIKFGVILWVLTYIGAWFNGMTLVILAFVALFTLPKVYENNKQSIDTYLDLVRSKILEITDKVKAAIPIGKKQETDKDK